MTSTINKYTNVKFVILFLLFVFSGAYLANITIFSPVYFSFILSFPLFIVYLLLYGNFKNNSQIILLYIFMLILFLYIFLQMLITSSSKKIDSYILYHALSFVYLPIVIIFYQQLNVNLIKFIIKKYLFISTLFLIIDALRRFMLVGDDYFSSFYNFKFNGIMFMDSNFSAFYAMTNFAFMYYLKENKFMIISKYYLFLQFFIILLNFSRAAIIAILIFIFLCWLRKQNNAFKFISIFLLPVLIFMIYNYASNDSSGHMKFKIITGTIKYIKGASVNQLCFGNGIFSSKDILGMEAHNFISNDIIEFGFIFLFFRIILFMLLFIITNKYFAYILIPYLIAGLSMTPGSIPYFYAIAGMMYVLKDFNNAKETLSNSLCGTKRKAHGAQEPRHIQKYVEVTNTAQRSDSHAQRITQRFPKPI